MKLKLEDIPELSSKSHPFFLLPEHQLELATAPGRFEQVRVPYREAGHGKPILLLHGLWTSAMTFRFLVEPLSRSYRVIMPELTHPRPENLLPNMDYRPQRLAALFMQICQALNLTEPLIVGHAESGLAALMLALEQPNGPSSLITMGMSIQLPVKLRLKGWWAGLGRKTDKWALKGFSQPQQAARSMLDYANPTMISRQEIRHLAQHWSNLPSARATSKILVQTLLPSYRQSVMRRLTAHLATNNGFPVPLKLLYGGADRQAPPQQGEKLKRLIPGSELMVSQNSCGSVQVDNPDWTAQIIAQVAGV